jgi:uncharacterized membrane protein
MFDFSALFALPAYIDGGTGSMIFQAAMGGILALSFFVTSRFSLVKSRVLALVKRSEPERRPNRRRR